MLFALYSAVLATVALLVMGLCGCVSTAQQDMTEAPAPARS
jgi:hypothetical protein